VYARESFSFLARVQAELAALEGQAQLRTLETNTGVNLCSNDYLGLATDVGLKAAILDGVSRTRQMGATGSRLLSGNSCEWEQLEEEFAQFAGTTDALYFSSGYLANIGLLTSLLGPDDLVFSDSLNHASIIDGIRLSGARKVIYPHRDLDALQDSLARHENETACKLIITESIFSMDGDQAPLQELLLLARKYRAELVVDEAHATGVHGPQGRGLAAEFGIVDELLAILHTCGKALASMGAFVCSGATLNRFLVNRARPFIFSTAMPPYFAHQIRAALRIAVGSDSERAQLRETAKRLRSLLQRAGFNTGTSTSQIVPVILGDNEAALHFAAELRKNGFAARAIRPPTVRPGTSRLRLSLTSKITAEKVDRLAGTMLAAKETFGSALHA
jgi:8-amino-7-oxononanoate synthase